MTSRKERRKGLQESPIKATKPVEETEIAGGILEMIAVKNNFPETVLFFSVPDKNGHNAIFRAIKSAYEFIGEDGRKKYIPSVAFFLQSAEIGNPMKALPGYAREIPLSPKHLGKGKIKKPLAMKADAFAKLEIMAMYLRSSIDEAIAEERRRIGGGRAQIEEISEPLEASIERATDDVTPVAKEGKGGVFMLGRSGAKVWISIFKNGRNVLCVRPVKIDPDHKHAVSIGRMIADNKHLMLYLAINTALPAEVPPGFERYKDGLVALHEITRDAFALKGLIPSLKHVVMLSK